MNSYLLQYLLFACYTAVGFLLIRRIRFFHPEGIPKGWVSAAFGLKIAAGLLLWLVYTYYYTDRQNADIYKYFDDGTILWSVFRESPADFFRILFSFQNEEARFDQWYGQMNNWYGIYPTNLYGDGHILIRFNAVVRFISLGSLPVHTLVMVFLSFSGLMALYHVFSAELPERKPLLFGLLFLFPSLLFWSSGVLKEGLILFAGGMALYHLDRLLKHRIRLWSVMMLLLSLLILRYSKFYLFALMLPLMVAYTWVFLTRGKYAVWKYAGVLLLTFGIGLSLQYLNPYNNIPEILANKHNDFIRIAREQQAGSLFSVQEYDGSWMQLVWAMLPGFLQTLVRPLPWETFHWLSLPAMLENLVIWTMLVMMLLRYKRPSENNLLILCILFFVLVYTLAGIMAPVSGALVRYKVPALPFLIFLFLRLSKAWSLRWLSKAP